MLVFLAPNYWKTMLRNIPVNFNNTVLNRRCRMGEGFRVSAWSVYLELCFKIVELILDCNHSVLKQVVIAQLHWEFCV